MLTSHKFITLQQIELEKHSIHTDFSNFNVHIEALLLAQELIADALREKEFAFPILTVWEILANTLIHHDFSVTGT